MRKDEKTPVAPEFFVVRRDLDYLFRAQRMRQVTMSPLNVFAALNLTFVDGSLTTLNMSGILPADYVVGTSVQLRWMHRPRATGVVLWNWSSWVHADRESWGTRNPHNAVGATQAVTTNLMATVSPSVIVGDNFSLIPGDLITFALSRSGAHASDTAAGNMDTWGVWFEYTATYDYQQFT